MHIPREFKELASLLDLSLHDGAPTEAELIRFAIRHSTDEQLKVAADYLDSLLGHNLPGEDLQKIWFQTGAGIFMPNSEELLVFLRLLRSRLRSR